jgi:hypothetical protein
MKMKIKTKQISKHIKSNILFAAIVRIYKKILEPLAQIAGFIVNPLAKWLKPSLRIVKRKFKHIVNRLSRRQIKWLGFGFGGLLVIVLAIGSVIHVRSLIAFSYRLPVTEQALIGQPDKSLLPQLTYDTKAHAYYLNKSAIDVTAKKSSIPGVPSTAASVTVGADPDNKAQFSLKLPTNANLGITTYDNNSNLSFTMVPLFSTLAGKQISGHIEYPMGLAGNKAIYTVKTNGIQEDIIYASAPKSSIKLRYKLELPSTLQAKMMPGGNLGIYSASPYLFGNITYGSAADQQKVQMARQKSPKDNLVFVLPAPQIITADGHLPVSAEKHIKLTLAGNIITITASGLGNLRGPISIDPSVVVASASNFMASGNNEGDITYNSSNSDIYESNLTGATIGSWAGSTNFTTTTMPPRDYFGAVIYNNYIYVMGGISANNTGDCTGTGGYCNGVFYDSISTSGTLGSSWTNDSAAYFPISTMPARDGFEVVAYNGYMYVLGGKDGVASTGDCNASDYCNGVFYDNITNTGALGATWTATTVFTATSMPARTEFGAVAYNGYLYVMGGIASAATGDCTATSDMCNGVFYNSFLATGAISSTWTATTTFFATSGMPARDQFGVAAYNGYMYVLGGLASASTGDCTTGTYQCSGVFYDSISSTGVLGGTWTASTSFPTSNPTMPARDGLGAFIFDGYLYALGGYGATATGDCASGSNYCSGVFEAPVNANGTIGNWAQTTSFTGGSTMPARQDFASVAYQENSYYPYIYVLGGLAATSTGDCTGTSNLCSGVWVAPINSEGQIGSSWIATTAFTTTSMPARAQFGTVAYNGYIYVLGGQASAATGDCTATSDMCNGVFYDNITSAGALGASWTADTAAYFPTATMPARAGFGLVAYDGYMYVLGGIASGTQTGTDCTAALDYCNGVFYDNITSTGALGTSWTATTVFTATSMPARELFGAVAYNNYIFVVGGLASASTGDCTATSDYCQGIFYDTISATGALGSAWSPATADFLVTNGFPARDQLGVTVVEGWLMIQGGKASVNSGDCATTGDVCTGNIMLRICKPSGYIYEWCYAGNVLGLFNSGDGTSPVYDFGTTVWNNVIYVAGGISSSTTYDDCTATNNYCSGTDQAEVDADGNGSSWILQSTAFTATSMPARAGLGVIAYNGYLYVLGGQASAATGDCTAASDMCNGAFYTPINDGGPGTISSTWTATTSFTGSTTMPARQGFASVAYNGYLYVLGGQAYASGGDCTSGSSPYDCTGVWYALICTGYNSSGGCTTSSAPGTIGTWTQDSAAPLTVARVGLSVVAYNGYIYYLGGQSAVSSGDCSSGSGPYYCSGVFYDSIGSNGVLGSGGFTSDWYAAISAAAWFGAVAYNGYMYVMGGYSYNGSLISSVMYDSIGTNGQLGGGGFTGTTAFPTSSMPARDGFSVVAYNSYLYVIGGFSTTSAGDCTSGSSPYDCNGVWYAQICSATNVSGYDYYYNPCSGDAIGTISAWEGGSSLENYRGALSAVAYDGYLYVMGGESYVSAGDCTAGSASPYECNGVFYAPIYSEGEIGAWNSTTSFTGSSTMPARLDFAAVAYNGYLYVLGGYANVSGGDCTTGSSFYYCTGVFETGLQSTPRVGLYSDLIDFTGLSGDDSTPTQAVINGGDCIVAFESCTLLNENPGRGGLSGPGGVIIKYKFASNACTTFNSLTTLPTGINLIGINQPLTYTTNGCSTTTNIGRYMWIEFSLDDSQNATFPDYSQGGIEVSSSLTAITNLTVDYHSAANSRLRGGGTFSNGSLNSLDTPPAVNLPISAVGSVHYEYNTATLSLSNSANGDILAGACWGSSSGETITVSGGGVTNWNYFPAYSGSNAGFANTQRLFWGVITSTGSQTLTWSGLSGNQECVAQEFTAGAMAAWAADGTGGTYSSPGIYIYWANLTPTNNNELYFGFSVLNSTGGGTYSTGYTYYKTTTKGYYFVYNTNISRPSGTPVAYGNSNGSDTVAGLIWAHN